ncbi:hypothetical protein SAMN04487965_2605 [Microbulbifer donghaiensis]|uniref:PilZ domain-containing protein n=1 Tax=Microbulbifer donghaiensis TaxID=494016 RepID=A0A1M5E6E7_9GAMM|nr:hypothetical protein [Microbulbifer donghaiensis]SHF74833.1 hypothetical protein SAMN04487965_2605 [Microbulbifer donghaiensis]
MQDAVEEVAAAMAAETHQKLFAKLQLPALSLPELSCGCASERQLFSWLEKYDLQPYQSADQLRLASLLSTLIDEVAQWRAPASKRLAMLDLLREYAVACAEAMAIQRAVMANAQTAELRKIVLAAVRLLQQLGKAFASVAQQLTGESGLALILRERRARSLQRAVDSYARVVQIVSLFGLGTPQHCWRNMQILVRLAQLQKLDAKQVGDTLSPRSKSSATGAYLQVVLFASANPTQLNTREQELLWGLARDWSRAAQIVLNFTERENALLASLALDQPPVPANRLGNCKVDLRHFTAPQGWKVDLTKMLDLLERQMKRRHDPLLEKLYHGWASKAGRSERRTPLQQNCEFVIGIGAICHHLGADAPDGRSAPQGFFQWSEPDRDHLCLEVPTVDYGSGKAVGEYDVVLPSAPSLRRDSRARAGSGAEKAAERYRPQVASVLNCSGRGIGLSLPPSSCDKLRVGELVGIRLEEKWQVAVVRWQHTLPDHSRAGVEVLAADSMPVQVQRHTAAGHLSAPIAGLLVKSSVEDKPALILPVPLFKAHDSVELRANSDSQPVTLQRQTLATGSFARFEFV